MCLSPKVIVNPEFYRRRHTFPCLYSNGNVVYQQSVGDFYYPLPYINGSLIDPNEVNEYYAFDPSTSECVPMYMIVPCGKCIECAATRQNEWKNRMILEAASHPTCPSFFLTLTYDDEHLPSNGVSRKHVSVFIKRLHDFFRHHGLPSFRSVVFSEYGSLRGRPHYHAVIFGFHTDKKLSVYKRIPNSTDFIVRHYYKDFFIMKYAVNHCWKMGFTYTVQIRDYKAFGYISKYVAKNLVCPLPSDSHLNKNFCIGSRRPGIGNLYINESNIQDVLFIYPRITVSLYGQVLEFTIPSFVRKSLNIPYHRVVKQKVLRKFKRWVQMNSTIYWFYRSPKYTRLTHLQRCKLTSILHSDIPCEYSNDHDLFSKIASNFKFLPPEFTHYLYSTDFFKNDPLWIDPQNILSFFIEYNTLTKELLQYKFPYKRYYKFINTRNSLKRLSSKYFNTRERLYQNIYSSDEKESFLRNNFHYEHRIKDEQ